jgi:hypothetical protein
LAILRATKALVHAVVDLGPQVFDVLALPLREGARDPRQVHGNRTDLDSHRSKTFAGQGHSPGGGQSQ